MTDLPNRTSTRKKTGCIAAALLALGAGVVGGIALGFVEPPGQARRMPHGPTLELRGWTFTPGQTFIDGSFWQQLALRLNQPYFQLGGFHGAAATGRDLALWFRTSHDPPVSGSYTSVWIDEHGCRLSTLESPGGQWPLTPVRTPVPPRTITPPPGVPPPAPEVRWAATPETRPRRGTGPLTFALVPDGAAAPVATFTVPRPSDPAKFPEWKGTPLPAKVASGNTTFVLERLRHSAPGSTPYNQSTPEFRYLGPDLRGTNWKPVLITVSDATGNRLVTPWWGEEPATFRSLCPHEPAWKLKVRFAHPDPAAVPPDATWTWRNVPVAASGLPKTSQYTYRNGDTLAELESVTRQPGQPWDPHPRAALQIAASCPEGFTLTLTRATDQLGKRLGPATAYEATFTHDRTHESGSRESSQVVIALAENSRRLNLTFALHRTRTVEFTVRP